MALFRAIAESTPAQLDFGTVVVDHVDARLIQALYSAPEQSSFGAEHRHAGLPDDRQQEQVRRWPEAPRIGS